MAKFVDGKYKGKLAMSGKTFLGVPKGTIKSSPAGSVKKQDKRGEDKAIFT